MSANRNTLHLCKPEHGSKRAGMGESGMPISKTAHGPFCPALSHQRFEVEAIFPRVGPRLDLDQPLAEAWVAILRENETTRE